MEGMTEFQVGDEVSVRGTVTAIIGREHPRIQFITPVGTLIGVEQEDLTLVERPRKKLRVGSVWEQNGPTGHFRWLVQDNETLIKLTPPKSLGAKVGEHVLRRELTIDHLPERWREVPVEELEREAQA